MNIDMHEMSQEEEDRLWAIVDAYSINSSSINVKTMNKATSTPEVRTIEVEGQQIPLFVADINAIIPMAVVSQSVLSHLASLLPKASLYEIKRRHENNVREAKTIEEYCDILKKELEFHMSINLIKEYFHEEPASRVVEELAH